jgi:excisionase family DNA binding protein
VPSRRPNHRLVKIHRSYSVEEAAALFGTHRNTIRRWIKAGLPVIDQRRPVLMQGQALTDFLQARRAKSKQTCQPGEIYCVRCRVPRSPAGEMADYQPLTDTLGNLTGICPVCEAMIYRRVNATRLEQVRGKLQVTMPLAL